MEELLKYRLVHFVNNPYDLFTNLDLGTEYEKKDQLASAISHYLRAAEFGIDGDYNNKEYLISECLLHAAECMNKLGGRHHTTKCIILNAISHCPKMTQSYLLMSKVYEQTKEWQECNAMCNLGISMMDFFIPMQYDQKTREDILNELLFQRAVSEYHVGRVNQAKEQFSDLIQKPNTQYWIKQASENSLKSI